MKYRSQYQQDKFLYENFSKAQSFLYPWKFIKENYLNEI